MANPIAAARIAAARADFAAYAAGNAAATQYAVTPWREWLFRADFTSGGWYAVTKADPTGKLRNFPRCSLAQAKANLRAGY